MILTTMILAVVVVAYAALRWQDRRANRYRQLAQFHARRARMHQESIGSKERAAQGCEAYGGERMLRIAREYREEAKLCVKLAPYHDQLRAKYEHAAAHPWLPLAVDPPEPRP
jgi:hypothetical protein